MAANSPKRLKSRIRDVFLLQGSVAALVMIVLVFIGSWLMGQFLLRERVRAEADRMWELIQRDPTQPLPIGYGYRAWFVPTGKQPDAVPPQMRVMATGFQDITGEPAIAYVGEHAEGRLYMRVEPGYTQRVVRWVSVLAATLALIAVTILSWLGHRRFRRMLRPLERLSSAAERWRPDEPSPLVLTDNDAVHEPVSEVERLRQSMVDMTQRMVSHVQRERDFTRDASHELRTPLTVLKMAGDLLHHETGLTPRGMRAVQRIDGQVTQMEGLVDAFLMLARDPAVEVDLSEVDMVDVARDAIEQVRPRLSGKPVELRLDVLAHPLVEAPLRLPGVLLGNLLQNACDFTETGEVVVKVDAHTITVSDTGIGMDDETLGRAFDPFFRADIGNANAKGLGLNVVRRLAERLGWTVHLDSEPGAGTIATLRFT